MQVIHDYLDATLNVDKVFEVGESLPIDLFDRKNSQKRDDPPPPGFKTQKSCKRQLDMVSQPPTELLLPLPPSQKPSQDQGVYNYNYVEPLIKDVWVYLMDDGANREHPVYLSSLKIKQTKPD